MKRLTLYILLSIITVSCSSTIQKSKKVQNQPITDYLETIDRDSVIFIHEDKLPRSRAIRTMETGSLPDPIYRKYAVNFLESEYYKEDAWKSLKKKYGNDTIRGKWSKNDFTLPHEIISLKYVIEQRFNLEAYETQRRFYVFSDILYYDNNQYAMFSIKLHRITVISGTFEDVLIIMKKKNGKWVLVDKILNDAFVNP